jgi:integrase
MSTFSLRRYGPKNNWYVFWTEDGCSERRSTRTPEFALAGKWRDNFLRDLLMSTEGTPQVPDIGLILDRYQDEKGIGSPSERANATAIAGFKKFFGEDLLASELVLSRHIAYEKHCRKLGNMASTINKRRSVLIAALNHARKNALITTVPHVPLLPTPPAKTRYLTRDEAARMIREARRRGRSYMALFLRIGLYTGARPSAVLQLTWDRVDLQTGRIDFRLPGEVETKKRRPNAPINFMLLRALRAARRKAQGNHVISYHGGPIGLIRKGFLDVCKAAHVKGVSPHTLKHTFITWALQNRVPPWQVSGLTATSVATLPRVYGHHVQDDLELAANAVVGRNAQRARNNKGI